MGISRIRACVISQERIASGIYSMWLDAPQVTADAAPGQFISVYSNDRSRLLPRPISICETDKGSGALRIVYRVAGAGTGEFSGYKAGDEIDIMGPLGNGYELDALKASGNKAGIDKETGKGADTDSAKQLTAILAAGGIGIPPMLELAKNLNCRKIIVLGYKDETFLDEELRKYGDVFISTEDGSLGTHGNILDAIRENNITGDVIYSCGPLPMLRAVKKYAAQEGIPSWISLEEKMACGIGACLACVCQSAETDSHSKVHNKRICRDGPVFNASEVII